MKIGLVCPYRINKHGGVQEVVLALKDGLVRQGHTVKIITPQPRGHVIKETPDVIFIGTSTDFRSPTHTTVQVSSPGDVEKIDTILETEQFDILHFHEPWVPFLSRQILQRSKSINIATFHSNIPETLMARTVTKAVTPYLKSVLKDLHELTAVSRAGAEYAASLTDQPITIIPNGINVERYRTTKVDKGVGGIRNILYIGRLEKRKGVKYLLQAYELLQQSNTNVELVIAGDGPERTRLELQAKQLKLRNVSFLGYVTEETKLKLLADADLFCSPAVYGESFGIVLLEALASGTVCVAGNNAGYSDFMQGLGAISIVNPADGQEFARRLHLLLTNMPLRTLWQQWASEYVSQYDYSQVVRQYAAFYQDAINNAHNSGLYEN